MKEYKELDNLKNKAEEKGFVLYDICFRNAGVGIMFFDENGGGSDYPPRSNWKNYLFIDKYYDTLREAIVFETERFEKMEAK